MNRAETKAAILIECARRQILMPVPLIDALLHRVDDAFDADEPKPPRGAAERLAERRASAKATDGTPDPTE